MYTYYGYNFLLKPNNISNISEVSPLTFNPQNCKLENSWVLPKVAASQIAIVGDTSQGIMKRINDYMTPLQKYWSDNEVNNLTLVPYATLQDLSDYIASDQYLAPNVGVCFGIYVEKTADGKYEESLIF
jgi:hypothetical protein